MFGIGVVPRRRKIGRFAYAGTIALLNRAPHAATSQLAYNVRLSSTTHVERLAVKTIKTYPTNVEADVARIALEAAGIPSVVVGIDLGMEGGGAGVQLLVPNDRVEEALTLLRDD